MPPRPRLPSFLVIGAAKCGTTSLHRYLDQHPDIFMCPVKEPKFFAFEGETLCFTGPGLAERIRRRPEQHVTRLADYEKLFVGASHESQIGEVSCVYMFYPAACERIHRRLPDVKLIALLRDPCERAYAHYLHQVRNGQEPLADFGAALRAEPQRREQRWGWPWAYAETGFYHRQLAPFFQRFSREQIAVRTQEEFNADPRRVMAELLAFLGVDASFPVDVGVRHNPSGIPRSGLLQRGLRGLAPGSRGRRRVQSALPAPLARRALAAATALERWNLVKPPMPDAERARLIETYQDDIQQLEDLLGRDLPGWLRGGPR